MTGIRIVTDSTTDLPQELLDRHLIEVLPLTVLIDGVSYEDNVDIMPLEFIHKMKHTKELPKTSQPSIGKFIELFDRLGADGSTVISIHMTSGMSGTYATACAAADMTASHVIVIDSQMISQALGFQVIEAAELAKQGTQAEDIVERLKRMLTNTSLYVVVDTLEILVKGGRVGKAVGWLSGILSIKPIAKLENGVYTPLAKVRTATQIIRTLTERFAEETAGKVLRGIGISHADNMPLAERLKQEISKLTDVPVTIRPATPVITTHTGAGAIGFMYYME